MLRRVSCCSSLVSGESASARVGTGAGIDNTSARVSDCGLADFPRLVFGGDKSIGIGSEESCGGGGEGDAEAELSGSGSGKGSGRGFGAARPKENSHRTHADGKTQEKPYKYR